MTPLDGGLLLPAAIDALRSLWDAVFAEQVQQQTLQVLDGDPITWVHGDYLTVGMGGDDVAVEGLSDLQDFGGGRSEAVDVANAVWAAGGDTEVKLYRDRAAALFRTARSALVDDPTLGGAVTRAELASYVYRPVRSSKGAGAAIEFTVRALTL